LLAPRISTDFSSHFHIRKNHKNATTPAWILHFTNTLHLFLGIRLWMNLQVIDFTQDTKREKPFDLKYRSRKFTLVL
jgi:hypothetical protein